MEHLGDIKSAAGRMLQEIDERVENEVTMSRRAFLHRTVEACPLFTADAAGGAAASPVPPSLDDGLGRLQRNDTWGLRPTLLAGWKRVGDTVQVRGISVVPVCPATGTSLQRLVLCLPQEGLVETGDGRAQLVVGQECQEFVVLQCMRHAVPHAPLDDEPASGGLSKEACAQLTAWAEARWAKASTTGGPTDVHLTRFSTREVHGPQVGFVWDSPRHGTLFSLEPITAASRVVWANGSGSGGGGASSHTAAAATWGDSTVTLHDALIDRPGWTPCADGARFVVLPHKVKEALECKSTDKLEQLRDAAPLLYQTLLLLLRCWGSAVHAALQEGAFADLLALDAVLSVVVESMPYGDDGGAGRIAARDWDVAERAVRACVGGEDAMPSFEDEAAERWLEGTLVHLRGQGEAAARRRVILAYHVRCAVEDVDLRLSEREANWGVVPSNSVWVLVEWDLAPGQTAAQALAAAHGEVQRACRGVEPDEEGLVMVEGITETCLPIQIKTAATAVMGEEGEVRRVVTTRAAAVECRALRSRSGPPCKNRTLHASGRCHYHRGSQ